MTKWLSVQLTAVPYYLQLLPTYLPTLPALSILILCMDIWGNIMSALKGTSDTTAADVYFAEKIPCDLSRQLDPFNILYLIPKFLP